MIDNAGQKPVMRSVSNPTQFLQAPVSIKTKDDSSKESDNEMKDVEEKDNDDEDDGASGEEFE